MQVLASPFLSPVCHLMRGSLGLPVFHDSEATLFQFLPYARVHMRRIFGIARLTFFSRWSITPNMRRRLQGRA